MAEEIWFIPVASVESPEGGTVSPLTAKGTPGRRQISVGKAC